jgi:diguanylate cyclase (GGDEF)-like protein
MDGRKTLLVITNDSELRGWFDEFLRRHRDVKASMCPEDQDVEGTIARTRPHAVVLHAAPSKAFDIGTFKKIGKIDPLLPVITITEEGDSVNRLLSLKHGAHSSIGRPLGDGEEVYAVLCNAVGSYKERSGAARDMMEMKSRCEAERLNVLELELVKGLQHLIGETEEPVSILKHAFSLVKSYLAFEVFAALIPRHQEVEIHVYPNVPITEQVAEAIPGTLIRKMASLAEEQERKIRVMIQGSAVADPSPSEDLRSVIVPLITDIKTHGYAGIYRNTPFDYQEESVFKRFCAHIAIALEKNSLFEEIRALSANDGLTGLYNHLFIMTRLEQEVVRSQRYGAPLSVLMFDIDDFKDINDRFGHLAGDTVLTEMARTLQGGLRSIDSVGRFGGEEFLVILPETDGKAAMLIGDRLREALSNHVFCHENKTMQVSVSGGVAMYRDGRDASALVGLADENLYRAKREGKNMVCYDGN